LTVIATPQIGHNGGPPVSKGSKLTAAQLRALKCIRDHGNSAHGLRTNSQIGGWNNTHNWMIGNGLSWYNLATDKEHLTVRGERVLAAGRLVD
jgi:hypothetical protein